MADSTVKYLNKLTWLRAETKKKVIRVQILPISSKIADKVLASWIIAARRQIGSEKTEKYY